MGKLNMKPFSIGEYLKNPNRELITRGGRKVRIICTDRKDADYPIVVLVSNKSETGEDTLYYTEEGKFYTTGTSVFDLFFAPEKKIGWTNLYKDESNHYLTGGPIYNNEADAVTYGSGFSNYIKTIKLEWEE